MPQYLLTLWTDMTVGRVLHADLSTMDDLLPMTLLDSLQTGLLVSFSDMRFLPSTLRQSAAASSLQRPHTSCCVAQHDPA